MGKSRDDPTPTINLRRTKKEDTMSPTVQAFIDALAKQGIDLLPYAKYIAIAYALWFVFVGVMAAAIFVTVIYQFWKMNRDF